MKKFTKHKDSYLFIRDAMRPIIELFFEYAQLKNLYRTGWKNNGVGKSAESVADHSFGVALLGYVLATEYRTDLDAGHVMKLGLFHELGEVYGGDVTPDDHMAPEEKVNREYESVVQVFSKFPDAEKYISIWKEFEEAKTPEAVFTKQIDKLEMGLQANLYEKIGYGGLDAFFSYVDERLAEPAMRKVFEEVMQKR